ncbi:M23 family metallopeptidase [Oceanobacillus halotolerans]|uniref:M23 family metallopeptidase n=1 Tax=Oceanobacillus halotolerans TaxID=2663380 RepID=UPI001CF7B19D|nr:M23 family metallopeptidase [Oceanobacillus halotolerans]
MLLKRTMIVLSIVLICLTGYSQHSINAEENNKEEKEENIYDERMALYKKTEALTQIPWYYLAAIDQYERNTQEDASDDDIVSITLPSELWFGSGNVTNITNDELITLFNGKGKDGNGDKHADPNDPEDVLYTVAMMLKEYGPTEADIRIALWNYYKRDLTVQTIKNTAKVFKEFQEIELTDRDFPVSIGYNYTYHNTWGDRRGFGGARIHEGTDIFADYGTPILATTYGVVELKGWNLYGGWRIGIRDIHNIYHYYGHMSGYEDGIEVGDIVKPGDVLGSVGSTGYGPPGTSGKFPPHLHYGMYRDTGDSEFSFDPYPYLQKWERIAKDKR